MSPIDVDGDLRRPSGRCAHRGRGPRRCRRGHRGHCGREQRRRPPRRDDAAVAGRLPQLRPLFAHQVEATAAHWPTLRARSGKAAAGGVHPNVRGARLQAAHGGGELGREAERERVRNAHPD